MASKPKPKSSGVVVNPTVRTVMTAEGRPLAPGASGTVDLVKNEAHLAAGTLQAIKTQNEE